MIFTDGIHLISDSSIDELHVFAKRIGLKREWFQKHRYPYYDLTTDKMSRKAIQAGAGIITPRQIIKLFQRRE